MICRDIEYCIPGEECYVYDYLIGLIDGYDGERFKAVRYHWYIL